MKATNQPASSDLTSWAFMVKLLGGAWCFSVLRLRHEDRAPGNMRKSMACTRNKNSPFSRREKRGRKISSPYCLARIMPQHARTNLRPPRPLKKQRAGRLKARIASPSLAGQTVIVDQAVLLAPVHRSSAPSRGYSVTFPADSLAVTVAGPRRLLPASLLSLATPDPIRMLFYKETLIK